MPNTAAEIGKTLRHMNHNYTNVSTKLSDEETVMLDRACKKLGVKRYELLQMLLTFCVRMVDKPHGMTDAEEAAMAEFMEIVNHRELLMTAKPGEKLEVAEMTLYMRSKDNKGKGSGIIGAMVEEPFMGEATISYNVQLIVERCFCLLLPEFYRALRMVGSDMDSNSILETLRKLLIEHRDFYQQVELMEEFSDNDRHDWGKSQQEIRKYKGHYNREPK